MAIDSYSPDIACVDHGPESRPFECDGALQRLPKKRNLELFRTVDMPQMFIDGMYLAID